MKQKTKLGFAKYYLFIVLFLYFIIIIIRPSYFIKITSFFFALLLKLLLIFLFVIFLLTLTNYFFDAKKIITHINKKTGFKAWGITIAAGIISSGPIYIWYPLLAELKNKGIRQSLIACFLYNRAIKPALIPMMIFYFGLAYTMILGILMVIFSVLNGLIVEKIVKSLEVKNENSNSI